MITGSIVRLHREMTKLQFTTTGRKMRKAKAQPELMLDSVERDNKKGFFKNINSKRSLRKTLY